MPLYRRPGSPFWWVRIGRKTRRSTGTSNRADAEEFEHVLAHRTWRKRKLGDHSAISWAEVCKQWLADSSRPRKRDRELLGWLRKYAELDNEMLSEIADADALREIREEALSRGLSHATIDRMMNTVRAVLRACVSWRYLESVPKVPMYHPPPQEPRWLTHEQFWTLHKELPAHLKPAAKFAVYTMLRMRSMGRLTWDRVDLKGKRAWVPRGHMKAGQTFGFPLSKGAIQALREARRLNPSGERVFQFDGRPIDNFNTEAFRKAARRAGVLPLRWHDLRHTGASWAVQSGVTLQELMLLGDWRSYRMVLRYAHLAPSHLASAAEKVAHRAHTAKRALRRKAPVSRGASAA